MKIEPREEIEKEVKRLHSENRLFVFIFNDRSPVKWEELIKKSISEAKAKRLGYRQFTNLFDKSEVDQMFAIIKDFVDKGIGCAIVKKNKDRYSVWKGRKNDKIKK